MGRVALLALTASLNPTLLTATTVMLLLERPRRLMLGYLCGAYLTSITVGLVIVLSFPNSGAVATTQKTVSPAADIALGAVALAASMVLRGGRRERLTARVSARRAGKGEKQPPRWRRELSKGTARTTFVLGVILTLPGASYLVALHEIHGLQLSTATTVLVVVGFNIVMLWLLEVPLASFFIAPEWTPVAVERAKAWVGRHAWTFAERGLLAVGVLLVLKGVIGLT